MATSKRDRQRANRQAKQAEQQKVHRKQVILSRSKRIAIWVVIGVVLFVVANLVFGGDSEASAATHGLLAALAAG